MRKICCLKNTSTYNIFSFFWVPERKDVNNILKYFHSTTSHMLSGIFVSYVTISMLSIVGSSNLHKNLIEHIMG